MCEFLDSCGSSLVRSPWFYGITVMVVVFSLGTNQARAFEMEFCEDFSQEVYYQKVWQETHQQNLIRAQYQYQIAYEAAVERSAALAEQRALEKIALARRARFAEESRRRAELIARRQAEKPKKNLAKTANKTVVAKN